MTAKEIIEWLSTLSPATTIKVDQHGFLEATDTTNMGASLKVGFTAGWCRKCSIRPVAERHDYPGYAAQRLCAKCGADETCDDDIGPNEVLP